MCWGVTGAPEDDATVAPVSEAIEGELSNTVSSSPNVVILTAMIVAAVLFIVLVGLVIKKACSRRVVPDPSRALPAASSDCEPLSTTSEPADNQRFKMANGNLYHERGGIASSADRPASYATVNSASTLHSEASLVNKNFQIGVDYRECASPVAHTAQLVVPTRKAPPGWCPPPNDSRDTVYATPDEEPDEPLPRRVGRTSF